MFYSLGFYAKMISDALQKTISEGQVCKVNNNKSLVRYCVNGDHWPGANLRKKKQIFFQFWKASSKDACFLTWICVFLRAFQERSLDLYQCLHVRIVYQILHLLFICRLFTELSASIILCVFDILLLCWYRLNLYRIMYGLFGCVPLETSDLVSAFEWEIRKMDFLIKRTFCCDHDKNYVSQFHSIQYTFGFCSQDLFLLYG